MAAGGPVAVTPPLGTVTDLVEAQVARTPLAPAVVAGDRTLTYAQLDLRANRLGAHLQALGVGPDVPVAVFVERSAELAVGLLGVLKAGGACLPLDPSSPAERVGFMLADSAAPVILTQPRLLGRLPPHRARVVCLDADGHVDGSDEGGGLTAPPRVVTADHLAYVIYTSGSTGRPKGVMLPHGPLVNHHLAVSRLYELGLGDRVLQFCSVNFDVSIEEMFPTWSSGATVVFRDDDVPVLGRPWLEWLRRARVNILNLPTAYWHEWARDLSALGEKVPEDVRLVTVGGEKALGRAYRTWLQVGGDRPRWVNAYGPAEASIMATFFEPSAPRTAAQDWDDPPIGRPIANTTVHVLDDAGQPVAPGAPGDLHIGGAGLARGYLNQPGLTAERFVPDRFSGRAGARLYRTGDLVRFRPDGDLEFVGRNDQQVKLRGFRIEVGEVEAALVAHPDVDDAVVVGREDTPGARRLVAYVVPVSDGPLTVRELRRFLSDRFPAYMVPTAFVVLDAFPMTPNGKVDRQGLPAPALSGRQLDAADAPSTPTEKVLAAVWAQVLGVDEVGVNDDFFELGGHSLMATQVIAQAREAFGVELPLQAIFEASTVKGLAARLDQEGASGSAVPPLVPQPRAAGTAVPLSLAQQQMWGLEAQAVPPGLYNVTVQHRFSVPVDTAVLRQALEHLVARHETLRTSFAVASGQVAQSIASSAPVDMTFTDLSTTPEAQRDRALLGRIAQEDASPIDVAAAPLFRAHLFLLGGDASVLTVTFDHMICDGTSAYIFLTELEDAYSALAQGRTPARAPLRVQYADFATWQRRWLTEDRQLAQLEYWRRKLHGMPLGPAVPLDGVPTVPTRRIASRDIAVPAETYRGLKHLARSSRSTMFIVAAAAVQSVLSLVGGSTDIVVSTTLSGRQRAELEGVIGVFSGIGRIRTDLSGDPTFEQVVLRTRESVLGLFEHQDVPFMRVRDALVPGFPAPRPGSHPMAVLPVDFQYFHTGQDGWVPGLGVVERPGPDKGPDELFFRGQLHPLSITLLDDGTQLWGEANYKVDFYTERTIERLASGLERLLETVAEGPIVHLGQLAPAVAVDATRPVPAHRPVGSWLLED